MAHLWPETHYISAPPSHEFLSRPCRSLAILGSTGSIGRNTLAVINSASETLHICALAGARNIELLATQANTWHPPVLACLDKEHGAALSRLLDYTPTILTGPKGYVDIACMQEADCIVSAQTAAAGLAPTLAAALAGKVIALANKESLVLAGQILRRLCRKTGASILPIDSEHYAIFQCVAGRTEIKKLIITASGGPFRGKKTEDIVHASPKDALNHPKWNMGSKISIDSATLMNKGLEFIEAMQLYGIAPEQIQVLVHPQSIVHSLVEFTDSSLLAQLAVPDMRLPIAGCLLWPAAKQSFVASLDLAQTGSLTFEQPDMQTFTCLQLAMQAACYTPENEWQNLGMNPACIVLNAANEAAVKLFLEANCEFGQIPELISDALNKLVFSASPKAPQCSLTGNPNKDAIALANLGASLDIAARKFVQSACFV